MNEKIYQLHRKLAAVAEQVPNKVAMYCKSVNGYQQYTYAEIIAEAKKVATALMHAGIQPGDRVALALENAPEWGITYFGILYAGATAVPIDTQSTSEDLAYYLTDSGAKIIFVSSQVALRVLAINGELNSLQQIVILHTAEETYALAPKCCDYKDFCNVVAVQQLPEVSSDALASIIYTSGTTGQPKGVMLTHRNFCANFYSIEQIDLVKAGQHNLLIILPMHHSFPFMAGLIVPLFSQNVVTYVNSLKSEDILQAMRETGVTILPAVPQLFYLFYKKISETIAKLPAIQRCFVNGIIGTTWSIRSVVGLNLAKKILAAIHRPFGNKLQFFASGGAKLDPEIAQGLERFGFTVLEGYGLTETAPVVSYNSPQAKKLGAAGKIIPDVTVKINEPDAQGVGEVLIQGPNVMLGYYNKPKATAEVLGDGWFYTGDLGYLDSAGFLYIVGRKKEIIVLSNGKNISPEEVEKYYGDSPYIKELCVVAVGDLAEEKIVAVIVPDFDYFRQKHEVNIYERLRWELENRSKQYPSYKRIKGFIITKENLPRTRLGKLRRHLILQAYGEQLKNSGNGLNEAITNHNQESAGPTVESDLGQQVFSVVATYTQNKSRTAIALTDHLELDLGLDSLTRIEIFAELEKLVVTVIDPTQAAQIFTVQDLITALERAKQRPAAVSAALQREFAWREILFRDLSKTLRHKIALKHRWFGKFALLLNHKFLRICYKLFWRLEIFGRENLAQQSNYIICANHVSYLDGPAIAAALPFALRQKTYFLVYQTIFDVFLIRNLIKHWQIIPIDAARYLLDALQSCAYLLQQQKNLVVFPEGERSIDGKMKQFKKGVGILAQELNINLLPAYIDGAFAAWPRFRKLPRFRKVKIYFGKPCTPTELKAIGYKNGAASDYEAITLGIKEKIASMRRV